MSTTTLDFRKPLTRAELNASGLPDSRIAQLVDDGILRRALRGVYVGADVDDTHAIRAQCAATVLGPDHVAVDRTAAWLHGIDVLSGAEHEPLAPLETCVLRGRHPTALRGVRGRERDLRPSDIMSVGGIRTTTPLRTALDLGCHLRRREAMAALNEFARHHGVTLAMLRQQLPRYRRRRGVVQLRELISYLEPRVESQRESWVLLEILDAELPRPEPQVWVHIDGVPTYRLDLAYPMRRICVEYDGAEAHDRSVAKMKRDKDRRQWLRDHGWTVIVVKSGGFAGDALDKWLDELRDALGSPYTTRRW